jgi:WD40 repeat protein
MTELKNSSTDRRRPRRPLALDEAGVRGLRIQATSRAVLSPSKNSFLPQMQDVDMHAMQNRKKGKMTMRMLQADAETSRRSLASPPREAPQRQEDAASKVMPVLSRLETEFEAHDGALDLKQFTRAMLHHLDLYETDPDSIRPPVAPPVPANTATNQARGAMAVDLFRKVDAHSEETVSWEALSSYLIEHGMAGGDDTVDTIKTYEASTVCDLSKHEGAVDKLVYLQEIDSIVCISRNNRNSFQLYDPKRLTVTQDVLGHRGTVVNCCYIGLNEQVATAGVDLTICFWDSNNYRLRSRMSTAEIQMCLQYDARSRNLFSGSVNGSLSCLDLKSMTFKDVRVGHRQEINDLIAVSDVDLLASASSDGSILMWDTETMRWKKQFKGHKKGVLSLAYSTDYHCLLSAGVDQEALVWNPYVEKEPIFRLKGHTRGLCGIAVMPGTPQIISADVSGTFRLWDMRNFRCIQSFGNEGGKEFNTFCVVPPHKRIAGGGSQISFYDYMDEGGDEDVTDSNNVVDALYNPNAGSFCTLAKRNVKFWNAVTGNLVKVLRDVTPSADITSACLADNGQKIYLGDAAGGVRAHALHNGKILTTFEPHSFDVSRITTWAEATKGKAKEDGEDDKLKKRSGKKRALWVFSASWAGEVKFHTDERSRAPICHQSITKHRAGITCLTAAPELYLLGSGGNDMQVVLYDLRTRKVEQTLERFAYMIQAVTFIPTRCLLAVGDQGGIVSLFRVRPHHDNGAYLYHFKVTPDVADSLGGQQLPVAIGAIAFATEAPEDTEERKGPLLYAADMEGNLRCWDLAELCSWKQVVANDLDELFITHRANQLEQLRMPPQRTTAVLGKITRRGAATPSALIEEPLESFLIDDSSAAFVTAVKDAKAVATPARSSRLPTATGQLNSSASGRGLLDESWQDQVQIHLVADIKAHKDAVTSMYTTSDPRAVITCSQDRRVQLWSAETLEACGALLQTIDPNYRFQYNPVTVTARRLSEAGNLLNEMAAEEEEAELANQAILRAKLPAISHSASDTALRGRSNTSMKRVSSVAEGRRSASQLRKPAF